MSDDVGTYPTVIESVLLLERAGFGAPGKPNTLLAMVKEALAERATLTRERDGLRKSLDYVWGIVEVLNPRESASARAALATPEENQDEVL